MVKSKIVVFCGAGLSAESEIHTFRDIKDGFWYNYEVDKVATHSGWKKNPQLVMDFHNMLREKCKDKKPNSAHFALVELEKEHDVVIITQNVDNLSELAGSKNILHLHGEIYKSRENKELNVFADISDKSVKLYDCLGDLNWGDKNENGVSLRPHTVLFGEYPFNVNSSINALKDCDVLLIIGTSLPIGYTHDLLRKIKKDTKVYYIDPNPAMDLDDLNPIYIRKTATEGMKKFLELIKEL
jgi:NAD-dependent deacetylase